MKKHIRTYKNNIIINKEVADKIKEYEKLKKEMETLEKDVKSELMSIMIENGKHSVISNGLAYTLIDSYVKNDIDKDRLKKEQPEIYNQYLKETNVSASLKLKISD